MDKPPHPAPFGVDVDNKDGYVVALCTPSQEANAQSVSDVTGVATAYDPRTGQIHVLAENITHANATQRFKL